MNPLEHVRREIKATTARLEALRQSEKLLQAVYEETTPDPVFGIDPSEEDLREVGITKAIEAVLAGSPNVPFAPTTVRDTLLARNFQLVGDNPMASVHQILKRLAVRIDSPITTREVNGQTAYVYEVPSATTTAAVRLMPPPDIPVFGRRPARPVIPPVPPPRPFPPPPVVKK